MLAAATRSVPAELPSLDDVVGQAAYENFPVALHLLPSGTRRDLLAVYGFARLVDDVGDEATGDRLAMLRWVHEELDRAVAGYASHPVLVRTALLVHARRLSLQPFHELIQANVQDQTVSSYETYDELVAYCRLSAVPVGRLVLAIFDASSPETEALSDDVCTALQIVEHLQDVAEDIGRGRVYLPQQDLRDAGTSTEGIRDDVSAGSAGPALREVVAVNAATSRRAPAVRRAARGPAARERRPRGGGLHRGGTGRPRCDRRGGSRRDHQRVPAASVADHGPCRLGPPDRTPTPRLGQGRGAAAEGGRVNPETAYAACEAITRREAKNFAYGIRLLAPPERRALCAVYALARRIDDIGDGDDAPADKLDGARRRAQGARRGSRPARRSRAGGRGRRRVALRAAHGRVRRAHRRAARWTCIGTRYETIDDLVVYCRRVAGIGRPAVARRVRLATASVAVAPGRRRSGVALQLTNILRDVVEDRGNGRRVPPGGRRDERGLRARPERAPGGLAALVALECRRAAEWFATGAAAAAPARPPEPSLRGRDGRDLPPAAAPDRGGPGLPSPGAGSRSRPRRRLWVAGRSLAGVVP